MPISSVKYFTVSLMTTLHSLPYLALRFALPINQTTEPLIISHQSFNQCHSSSTPPPLSFALLIDSYFNLPKFSSSSSFGLTIWFVILHHQLTYQFLDLVFFIIYYLFYFLPLLRFTDLGFVDGLWVMVVFGFVGCSGWL